MGCPYAWTWKRASNQSNHIMKTRKHNFIERREKTDGGWIITQIDRDAFKRIVEPELLVDLANKNPDAAENWYKHHNQQRVSTLWKLKQFWRAKR